MRNPTKILSIALIGSLALAGCSDKEEVTQEDVQAAADAATAEAKASQAESEKKLENKLASGLASLKEESSAKIADAQADMDKKLADEKAEMESKLADEKAALKKEMEAKLAEETAALKQQFASSNTALKNQFESLKEKYNSVKAQLPEDIVDSVSTKLPQISSSLGTLESLTNQFSPSSMEQLNEFKTKYQSELTVAKQLADEVLKLLGKGSLESMLPKI